MHRQRAEPALTIDAGSCSSLHMQARDNGRHIDALPTGWTGIQRRHTAAVVCASAVLLFCARGDSHCSSQLGRGLSAEQCGGFLRYTQEQRLKCATRAIESEQQGGAVARRSVAVDIKACAGRCTCSAATRVSRSLLRLFHSALQRLLVAGHRCQQKAAPFFPSHRSTPPTA